MFRKVFLSACLLCFGAAEASAQQSPAPAAQAKPVRAPRIPAQPTRPGDIKVANIKPDLVVKEMRLEGDKAVHVLVANIGSADAGKFNVLFSSYGDGPDSKHTESWSLSELKAGEEEWLTFKAPFKHVDTRNPFLIPVEYRLADLKSFTVHLDVHFYKDAFQAQFSDKTSGDIVESDESNNTSRAQKSDLAPWPPPQ